MKERDYLRIIKNRENFYLFLSRLFEKEIDSNLLKELNQLNFPTEGSMQEGSELINSFLNHNENSNKEELLAVDYAKTFLGAGEANGKAAYPYESVYTSKEGLVMQKAWSDIKNIYAEKKLSLSTTMADIKEDHIAIELYYMSYLCSLCKDNSYSLNDQIDFLENHLLNWAPRFLNDVEKYSITDFYKGVAKLTSAFLEYDLDLLKELNTINSFDESSSSYTLSSKQMDDILISLKEKYKVFAPKLVGTHNKHGKNTIRYQEIDSINEVIYDRQSNFSAKEIYYPILQTMFYFTEDSFEESKSKDDQDIIILLHPCDINAMKRLDNIFLKNGNSADIYYKRLRDKVKIILLQCNESYENCFCVSMNSNITTEYDLAINFDKDSIKLQVISDEFHSYFNGLESISYNPSFILENKKKVRLPIIENIETLKTASILEYWNTFDNSCIGCGGCNTVCPTCSCFDTIDVIYDETSNKGERRRVWSSCMLDTFTMTAGGNRARKTAGSNMRFKTLHKVYDYRIRFGGNENMCIGCGRCINQCPEKISFIDTINEFTDALEKSKGEE